MRCCQSQNREHECDGAGGYGKDHNAVVSKKHGIHHGPPYSLLSEGAFRISEQFGNRLCVPPDICGTKKFMGTARVPETTNPRLWGFSLCLDGWGVPSLSVASRREMFHDIHPDCGGAGARVLSRRDGAYCTGKRRDMTRMELLGSTEPRAPGPVTGGFHFGAAQLESECGEDYPSIRRVMG